MSWFSTHNYRCIKWSCTWWKFLRVPSHLQK